MWLPALSGADVIHHSLPVGHGVSRDIRREIARAVREHVREAGHRLGKKRKAKRILETIVSRDGQTYVVLVRLRPRKGTGMKQLVGTTLREGVLSTLAQFLEQVLPTGRGTLFRDAPPGAAVLPGERPGHEVVSTWLEDQPSWPDLHDPPTRLAPFPPPVDPPPRIGEIRRASRR
jgi:hypothetical protein